MGIRIRWKKGMAVALWMTSGAAFAADSATLNVSATVVSNSLCWFTAGSNPSLNFGTINPTGSGDVTASTTARIACIGFPSTTFHISHDSGLYETGPNANRMRRTAAPQDYLRYHIDINPFTGTFPTIIVGGLTVNITGTIQATHYQNVRPGAYQDTVTLTVVP